MNKDEWGGKVTAFSFNHTLNCRGKIVDLSKPVVMGVLNITPDSFYDGGRYLAEADYLRQTGKMLQEGATIIDVGAISTKPFAKETEAEEERRRLIPALDKIRAEFPEAIISIDTYRSEIAIQAFEHGASMINDVSAGTFDKSLFAAVSSFKAPVVLMHMQGRPETMQIAPEYKNVVQEIKTFLSSQAGEAKKHAIRDVIIDPGFGFGKRLEDNYLLLKHLDEFTSLHLPVLVGLSRKSMINKVLNINPHDALNGTTVLNTIALLKGASILRVHDVKEAMEVIRICEQFEVNR